MLVLVVISFSLFSPSIVFGDITPPEYNENGQYSGFPAVDEDSADFQQLPSGSFKNLIARATVWLGYLVFLVVALAFLFFLIGVLKYINGGGDEEKRREARNLIVYGIIGLFIIVSIWSLVYFLGSAIGIRPGGIVDLPAMPGNISGQDVIDQAPVSDIEKLLVKAGELINILVYFVLGVSFLVLIWGIARYVAGGADEEKKTEARRLVVYGIVGLFVMVSVWAIVYFVGSAIGISPGGGMRVPQIDSPIEILKGTDGKSGPVTITGSAMTTCSDAIWPNVKSFKSLICLVLRLIRPIPPILMALAMLFFFIGVGKYMNSGDDAERLRSGKNTIIFGILGMIVISLLWGLVFFVQKELGL